MLIRYRNLDSPENRLLAGSLAGLIGNILLWQLLAQTASLKELGNLSLSLAVAAALAPLLLFGNNVTALVTKDASSKSLKIEMSPSGLVTLWKLILFATSIQVLLSYLWSNSYSDLGAYCASQTGFILSLALLRKFERYLLFLIFNVTTQIIGTLLLVIMVEWNFLQLEKFLLALSTWHLVCQLILFYKIAWRMNYQFELKNVFNSLGLIPHLFLYIVTVQGGKYLVSIRLGAVELGRYQILSVYAAGLLTLAIVSSPYLFDKLALRNADDTDVQFAEMYEKVKRFISVILFCTLIFLLVTLKMHSEEVDAKSVIGIHICFFATSLIQIRTELYSISCVRLTKYAALTNSSVIGVLVSLALMFLLNPTILIGCYFVCTALFVKMQILKYFARVDLNKTRMPRLDFLVALSLFLLISLEVI
jgi:hypothetical protein